MFKTLLLMVVMLVAGVGYQYSYQSSLQANRLQQDKIMMSGIVERVANYAILHDGRYMLPYGVNADGYHQLPSFLGVSRTSNAGIPIVYCPFSQNSSSASGGSVELGGTEDYSVSIVNAAYTNYQNYVSASSERPTPDVLAVLIAPNNTKRIPDCRDIALMTNGGYALSGGSKGLGTVHLVTAQNILADDGTYVYYASDSASLKTALGKIQINPEADHTIIFTGSNYVLDKDYHFESDLGRQGSITFEGDSGRISLARETGGIPLVFSFERVVINFDKMNVDSNFHVTTQNAVLNARDSSIPSANVLYGKAIFQNVDFNSSLLSRTPLVVNHAEVTLQGDNQFYSGNDTVIDLRNASLNARDTSLKLEIKDGGIALQLLNSHFFARGASLQYSVSGIVSNSVSDKAQAFMYISGGSTASFSYGDLAPDGTTLSSHLDYGIVNEGTLNGDNFEFGFVGGATVGVFSAKGSISTLDSVNIGVSADSLAVGLYDDGAAVVKGSVTVSADTCQSGDGIERVLSSSVFDNEVTTVNADYSFVVTSEERMVELDITEQFNSLSVTCL